jgi:leader peptidase (prepilin peptidase)/N-methyltransferase
LIGIAAGYVGLLALNFAYRKVRGRDGLGMGDAKFLAAAGAWLGWSGLPFVVLIASATGIVYVAARRIAGRALGGRDALAFGPFLCVGFFVVWVAQNYASGLAGY